MIFLTLDEIIAIHSDQIGRYGGSLGISDVRLLESALSMPQATLDGNYIHGTVYEIASAYLYHLVQNHPFVDGNKRTGLMAAIGFLGLNGIVLLAQPDELTEIVVAVASGKISKAEIAVFLQHKTRPASEAPEA